MGWTTFGPNTRRFPVSIRDGMRCTSVTRSVDSWKSILANDGAPNIRCREARASIYGETATVICFEEIAGDYLIATNVFHKEQGRWRLVHHQAAPTNGAPTDDSDAGPQTMN